MQVLFVLGVDVVAMAAVVWFATRVARHAIVGLIGGIVCEVMRVFSVMAIVGESFRGDTLGWLAALRFGPIPILVGVGFFMGAAAAQAPAATSAVNAPDPLGNQEHASKTGPTE